jgi:hypothetical protein
MKSPKLKFIAAAAVVAVGITAVSVYSCEKESIHPVEISSDEMESRALQISMKPPSTLKLCGEIREEFIISPKGKIGKVIMFNDSKYFYVLARTIKGFTISEAIMHAERKSGLMPLNSDKNPLLSAFEYKLDPKPNATLVLFQIPLAEIGRMSFVAVSIASINNTIVKSIGNESPTLPDNVLRGWVDGRSYGANGYARMFQYFSNICPLDQNVPTDANPAPGIVGEGTTVEDPKMP